MSDPDAVELTVAELTLSVPPMTFYALRRAWPHLSALARMNDAAADGVTGAAGDMMQQTDEALHIFACALELSDNPVSYEDLARALRFRQWGGVHAALHQLLVASGMIAQGEAVATGSLQSRRSNGSDSSLGLSPPA